MSDKGSVPLSPRGEGGSRGFTRPDGAAPLVLGHRGVRPVGRDEVLPPENTLEAFTVAADRGADGIELDVRPCATGELVVHHDETLERMTHGADRRAIDAVGKDVLARIALDGGARVPLLDDVLAWARSRGMLVNVEMKRDVLRRTAAVRKMVDAVNAHRDAPEWILVSSFDPAMLALFGVLAAHVPRGFLFHEEQAAPIRSGMPARLIGAGAVHPEHVLVTERRCQVWRRRGFAINVWTVNDAERARQLGAWGVNAIITDDPGEIGKAVRGSAAGDGRGHGAAHRPTADDR